MKTIRFFASIRSRLAVATLLVAAAATALSCSDDETREGFLDLGDAPDYLNYPTTGGSQTYEMYSDWNEWQILVDYDTEDTTWVDVWPDKGRGDGRFTITVGENTDDAYHRRARVTIVADNRMRKIITVEQDEVASILELDMDGVTQISSTNRASTTTVRLRTNVFWEARALDDAAEWIAFGEKTDNTLELKFERNTDMEPRTGYVDFVKIGTGNEACHVAVKVTQRGEKDDIDRAAKTTIRELLAAAPGEIAENCYIEGWVTSDLATGNIDSTLMFVQDESGRGLKIEFERQAENTCPRDAKVKLHMVGLNIVSDTKNGGMKVPAFPLLALIGSEEGSGATPVEVADLSSLDDYENTLVTLKNIEFAIPIGTYVNIDEANYKASGNPTSIDRGDTPRLYSHILRDAAGHTVKLCTAWQFTDKFATLIPQGSGEVTGIVMKRTRNGATENIIRLRSHADNRVSDDASTRLSRSVVRFGPWKTYASVSEIKADAGEGNLKTHLYKNCEVASGSNMYWAWTYARHVETTLDEEGNGIPAISEEGDKTGVIYSCLNQSDWLSAAGSTVEGPGGAWIATVSQKRQTLTGDLSLSFTTSSSQTGPRDFTAEWADTEDTKNAEWHPIGTYESCDWNSNYQLLQYNFRLPDELKTKESYVIRLRVTGTSNARSNGNYGTGGTNRIGYLEVSELK